jgi:endo-1,4-beta-xylanase
MRDIVHSNSLPRRPRTPGDYQANLQRFADLGVDVQITELDVTQGGNQANPKPTTPNPTGNRLRNEASGRCLDVNGARPANAAAGNGSAVIVWSCHGGANQRWARA